MKATKFSVMAVIALGSIMALAPVTRAQEKNDDDAKPKARAQRERVTRPQELTEELNLTDEQKPKLEAVLKERRERQQELRQNTDLSQEERVAKVREMRADIAAKVKAILNPEQFEKFEKWEKAQRTGLRARGARGEKPPGEKPPGDKPSGEKPPGEKPPGEKPPGEKPPGEKPSEEK